MCKMLFFTALATAAAFQAPLSRAPSAGPSRPTTSGLPRLPGLNLKQSTVLAAAAAAVLSCVAGPASADIAELLPQVKSEIRPAGKAAVLLALGESEEVAPVGVRIGKDALNLRSLSLNPIDPLGTLNSAVKILPKSVGLTLPVVNIPVRVDIDVKVDKVSPAEAAAADVVVELPQDLAKLAKSATAGDVDLVVTKEGGRSGRVDIDLATPRKGVAELKVRSDAVPKLPLAKSGNGRFCATCGNGEALSDWFTVTNVKNGVSFYTNLVTGVSQFNAPPGI